VLKDDGGIKERDTVDDDLAVRTCQYPWNESFQLLRAGDKFHVWPCCYMPKSSAEELSKRFGIEYESVVPLDQIFNSPGYWRFRRALAAGEMQDICGRCDAARNYPWKNSEL